MAKEKLSNARTPHQVFLEKELFDMATTLSRKYTKMGKPICGKSGGSASWYIRNALLERMEREGVKLDLIDLTDPKIYEIRR